MDAGFTRVPEVATHSGQGTASVFFVFENAYLELIWVDDPVAAFFLHVQGSGRVILDDGQVVRIGFAATNGLPFTAVFALRADSTASCAFQPYGCVLLDGLPNPS